MALGATSPSWQCTKGTGAVLGFRCQPKQQNGRVLLSWCNGTSWSKQVLVKNMGTLYASLPPLFLCLITPSPWPRFHVRQAAAVVEDSYREGFSLPENGRLLFFFWGGGEWASKSARSSSPPPKWCLRNEMMHRMGSKCGPWNPVLKEQFVQKVWSLLLGDPWTIKRK